MDILYIIIAILFFCVIIVVHELGHFFVARACKMKVYDFSIGMGPAIFKKKGKNTNFSLRALPIGGAVQLGEDEETDDPTSFRNKPVWQRMLVIVAGAVMNLILGLILCIILSATSDHIITTQIKGFYDTNVSGQTLQANDVIKSVNGMSIWTTMDISFQLQNAVPQETTEDTISYNFTVLRDGKLVNLDNVTFALVSSENGTKSLALDFYVYSVDKNIGTVITDAFGTFVTEGRLIWITLINLIKGSYGLNDLSGPVGVVQAVGQSASMGLSSFLTMISFMTINIGIFNLLPIPALDGGRFFFLLVEAIRRKPIKAEHEGIVHFVGFALLMLLMLVVTFNDILRLITGG